MKMIFKYHHFTKNLEIQIQLKWGGEQPPLRLYSPLLYTVIDTSHLNMPVDPFMHHFLRKSQQKKVLALKWFNPS